MTKYRDSLFARLVIRRKLVPKEKVEALLKEAKVRRKKGEAVTLESLLVSRGLLTKEQAQEILRYLEKDIVLCPSCRSPYDASRYKEGKEFTCKKCGARVTIQSEFSDSLQTTVKLGALLEQADEDTFEKYTSSLEKEEERPKESLEKREQESEPMEEQREIKPEEGEAEKREKQEREELPSSSEEEPRGETAVLPSRLEASQEEGEFSPKEEGFPQGDVEDSLPTSLRIQGFQQVNCKKVYPLEISLLGTGKFRLRCHLPGCVTVPDYVDIYCAKEQEKTASFWVLPLLATPPSLGRVEVWREEKLGEAHFPFRVRRRISFWCFFALFFLFSGLFLYGAYLAHFSFSKMYGEMVSLLPLAWQSPFESFVKWVSKQVSYPEWQVFLGLACLSEFLFLLFLFLFHWRTKAKAIPVEENDFLLNWQA